MADLEALHAVARLGLLAQLVHHTPQGEPRFESAVAPDPTDLDPIGPGHRGSEAVLHRLEKCRLEPRDAGEHVLVDVLLVVRRWPEQRLDDLGVRRNTIDQLEPVQVNGIGVLNPFRIRPMIGAIVPFNGTFEYILHFYNPYNYSLDINEIYTSDENLIIESHVNMQ